jgi:hypothetical protein
MRIFVQNQGMRKNFPQASAEYSKDKILNITQSWDEKTILQKAHPGIQSIPSKRTWRLY